MDLNSRIQRLIFFWLLITQYVFVSSEKHNFLKSLNRYIKHDREINQIMLLTDAKKSVPKMQELSRKISSGFQQFHFDNTTATVAQYLSQLPSFNNPRSTLFILITSSACKESLSTLSRPINFITELHPAKIRPKVLILIPDKISSSYNDLLRIMWSRQFLDATVLELIQTKYSKENSFIELRQEVANQHYFIPFTDTFVKKKYSSESDLFPDKLRNLHGYTMKVGLFHYPPYVFFIRNSTGHIVDFDGPDILVMNALSKALNFRVSKVISNKTTWDVNSCKKKENVGLFHGVMYNKLQFIGVEGAPTHICFSKLMEQSTSTRPIRAVAVVPIFADRLPKLATQWKFYNAIALMSLLLITWVITRLLYFDNRNWRMEYLMRILLGLGIPREPRVLAERIVLGSILLACVLQSSFIFTAFTSIELKQKPPQKIETIDDLISSELLPLLLPNVYRYLKQQTQGKLTLLTKGSIKKNITDELCVQYLMNYKNITCIMRKMKANWLINNYRNVDGQPVMRVLEHDLYELVSGNYMEAASPHVNRFKDVTRRFTEAGLIYKWDENKFRYHKATISGDETFILDIVESNVQIRKNIFLVLMFGYTCSSLAYIGEVLVHYFRKFLV